MLKSLNKIIETQAGDTIPAVTIRVLVDNEIAYQRAAGWLDPTTKTTPATINTLFDLASLTKLFTTTAFLRLVADGKVALDDSVSRFLPEFSGIRLISPYEDPLQTGQMIAVPNEGERVEASKITFRHLLTHTSGLPAWRPIFQQAESARRAFVFETNFAYHTGSDVVYSDLGLILLGWGIEAITQMTLAQAIEHYVLNPLGIRNCGFGPVSQTNTAPTEYCRWRQKRMWGEVHDENGWSLDGMAGHAGLFGTAAGVAELGQAWLAAYQGKSGAIMPQALAQAAVSLQAESGLTRRGLGWLLRSNDPDAFSYSLGPNTFGHTGFTGTSLMIDPDRKMVIALLTNEVYNGRQNRQIHPFRVALHRGIEGVA